MLHLANGCRCSKKGPEVYPKDWKTASVKNDWYIHYRFYSPDHPAPHRKVIKGMNDQKTAAERRKVTAALLAYELDMLKNHDYNPFTDSLLVEPEPSPDIIPDNTGLCPQTPFWRAIWMGLYQVKVADNTRANMRFSLRAFNEAAATTGLAWAPVGATKRKDVKAVFAALQKARPKWGPRTTNQCRTDLIIVFNEMIEDEAIDFNPAEKISKQRETRKKATVLSAAQRKEVDVHLAYVSPDTHRMMHIFFHSGSRTTEICRVQAKHVNLDEQTFTVTIKKRRTYVEVQKPIPDVALPLWKEVMAKVSHQDQYVFSNNSLPGDKSVLPQAIRRRWKRWVKDGLGIEAGFYKLKHLKTTTTITEALVQGKILSIDTLREAQQAAATHNGHTSTKMVATVYDVENDARVLEIGKRDNRALV